ncbi:hypothetical protein [Methylotuvimicrobium sp. KM2]|uniref:pilus assembly PilX family protein n=1 Tax=Methylotuvimicrobium sp. KM2 TaxID=3133976 RepID=UPI003100EA27
MNALPTKSQHSQCGAASVLVVLMLLIGMGMVAVTTSRTAKMEQAITGNDLRAREAQEMAFAGLEYAAAYATESEWVAIDNIYRLRHMLNWGDVTPDGTREFNCGPDVGTPSADCPTLTLPPTGGTTSGETYTVRELRYTRIAQDQYNGDLIRIRSVVRNTGGDISATAENYIVLSPPATEEGGASGFNMPPPWVMAGCLTTAPTGTPDTYLLSAGDTAVITGSSTYDPNPNACLPPGHLDVGTWEDTNGNGIMDPGEFQSDSTTFNSDVFKDNYGNESFCPSPNDNNCAWNQAFNGASLEEAKAAATAANNIFTGDIPCGSPGSTPIYLIHQSGNINPGSIVGGCSGLGVDHRTVGTPSTPVIMIVPTAYGCPKLNGGITIYGIVYYESTTACAANGWGGATIYGSVVWESDVDRPNANSEFIAIDYSSNEAWNAILFPQPNPLPYTVSALPGTWRDF